MTCCPHCKSSTGNEKQHKGIQLDYCPTCKLVFLDFGAQRPELYQKIEHQVQRWEAHLAERSTPA